MPVIECDADAARETLADAGLLLSLLMVERPPFGAGVYLFLLDDEAAVITHEFRPVRTLDEVV